MNVGNTKSVLCVRRVELIMVASVLSGLFPKAGFPEYFVAFLDDIEAPKINRNSDIFVFLPSYSTIKGLITVKNTIVMLFFNKTIKLYTFSLYNTPVI